jgi:succinate dehydrogenase/fumarate reductase flavoprotein subunit
MAEKIWHGHGFDPTHQPETPKDFEKHPLVDEASDALTTDDKDRISTQVEGLFEAEEFSVSED